MYDKGHIFVPSQTKFRGLYYKYYPTKFFYCDRTNLTPSDKKLGRGANLGCVFLLARNSVVVLGKVCFMSFYWLRRTSMGSDDFVLMISLCP